MKRSAVGCVLCSLFLFTFWASAVPVRPASARSDSSQTEVLRIEGRDWGFPSPYAFYRRGPGYVRMTLIFDSLLWRDDRGLIPWLAEEWRASEDGLTWDLTLAENARWHDGKPVTADDVVFTFEYLKKNPHVWFHTDVIEKVETTAPGEIRFRLNRPYAVFATRILSRIPIFPRHVWEKVENPYKYAGKDAVIGSGPFKLADYSAAQGSYLYEANTDFFKGRPRVNRLIFVPTKTADVTLLKGEIDMARMLNVDSLGMFKDKPQFRILTAPDYWLFRLVVNYGAPPLDQAEFRKALAHAINRPEMVTRVAHGAGVAGTYGYVSPASEWHNPEVADYPYDPRKAGGILDALNFKDGNGDGYRELPSGDALMITLLSDRRFTRAAEAVQKYLTDAGLSVSVDSADVSVHDSRIREMKGFHLALTAHGGISADLGNLTGGLPAIVGYDNPEYLELVKNQPYIMDPVKRKQALFRIQELIAEDVATLPLYYLNWFHVYRPRAFDGWFYTWYGLPLGVQLLENKLAFVR